MRPSASLIRQLAEEVKEGTGEEKQYWITSHIINPKLPSFSVNFQAEGIIGLEIPKRWGQKWFLLMSGGLGCSYALNRILCKWFELDKNQLAILNLQPMLASFSAWVWHAAEDESDVRIQVLSCSNDLWMTSRFGLYPYLVHQYPGTNCLLIDVLFIECPADFDDVQSLSIQLAFGSWRCADSALLNPDMSSAIMLDSGGGDVAALYAVPLSAGLETANDVADYLRNLLAWVDKQIMYNVPPQEPCPGNYQNGLYWQLLRELPLGYRCYLWGFSMAPNSE